MHFSPARFARIAVLSLALATAAGAVGAADKVVTVPVKFAKGTTGTTVKGAIKGYDSMEYLVVARAGQTLRLTISGSTNANVNVFPPRANGTPDPDADGLELSSDYQNGRSSESAVLPANGTYRIQVYQFRAIARRGTVSKFSLKIDIR
ncbi:g-type lysozyme inhibitor [Lysobacter enzymogenes]|uniref:g-type lysozyme inhibitor n=1 Tax=Lysobacter enzymogenes TaxID=69 RepID=UPI0009CFC004|nr:g-type lysozyme inhibitor [Lysobacter enzymogenes]UZW61079.1 g-type lysozyme inhibitor [Lysobacter enzymogenes]